MTPSATLPSSSTLTLVSAIEPPTTLARAFSAKRPNPLTGSGDYSTGRRALTTDVESMRIGQREGARHHVGAPLKRKASDSAAAFWSLAGPAPAIAQRGSLDGDRH